MEMPWTLGLAMVLRWLHVLGGIFWVGLLFYSTLVQPYVLRSLNPQAGVIYLQGTLSRVFVFMTGGAFLSVLAGLTLGYAAPRNPAPGHDWLGVGIFLGLGMMGIHLFVLWPKVRKLSETLRKGKAPDHKILKGYSFLSALNGYLAVPTIFLMLAGGGHFGEALSPWAIFVFLAGWTLLACLFLVAKYLAKGV